MRNACPVCLFFLAFLLAACSFSAPGVSEEPTLAPQAIYTSAAKTAEARRLERFSQTATVEPQSLIATSAGPSPTATQPPALAPTTPVSPTVQTAPAAPAGGDRAEFVADLSIPDGTVLAPNEPFQKGWQIQNTGQITWTTDYSLVFIDGALMGAPASVPIPEEVPPGKTVEITVDMVAPPDPGPYRGYWELRNANGKIFGFGLDANESIWVDIVVESALASQVETVTPAGNAAFAAVVLSVDNAQVSGPCPHTFIFTAQINLKKSATVSYSLEAGAKSGADVRLPLPASQNLEAGMHSIVYEVTVPAEVIGWARLHITQPVQAFSNQVDFALTCG
jgi:Ig-like domain from next to BRCA1 gene